MLELTSQLVVGISSGVVYGSLALALVMIYRATGHLNIAQGEMATFSTMVAWYWMSLGVSYWLAVPAVLLLSFLLGIGLYYLLIDRFSKESSLTNLMVTVGLFLVFNSISGYLFGHDVRAFETPFENWSFLKNNLVSPHQIGSMFLLILMLGGLSCLFRFTRIGLAMRAAAHNSSSAVLSGISVHYMYALGWGLAAFIGAVAGVMIAPTVFLEPSMMFNVLVYAFVRALLGGIDSPLGAVLGGIIVGVAETLLGVYVAGSSLKLSAALVLVIIVLIVRPSGIWGRRATSRA